MDRDRPRAAEAGQIAIVGAGIGGLALAQGLRAAGRRVTVFECDSGPDSRPQGYRIHISAVGASALRACLPPRLHALVAATSGRAGDRVTVLSTRLRVVRAFPTASAAGGPVNRLTLREALLAGLDDAVRFGWEFRRYEVRDGRVRLHFADHDPVDADVLVGADGVNSAVRRQLLPQAKTPDTGVRVVYGKTPLSPSAQSAMPEAVRHGFVAVSSALRPAGMALGLMQFRERPADAAVRLAPGLAMSECDDYLMWALTAPTRRFPSDPIALAGGDLVAVAARLTRRWHPRLRALIADTVVDQSFAVSVRTSTPVAPWPSGPVTVLGDAVHAMSPAGGAGANTALRDAALLTQTLASPDRHSIARYESAMLDYGFAAVAESERANARYRRRA